MKSKKLLIGLIVAAFVCGAHLASAQTKANYRNALVEIGPDNIAGRVRAIVVDNADPNHTTLYAGGVAGGLFKKVGEEAWQYIPFGSDNQQVTLPISCMVQLPDNTLLIGTGEGIVENHGISDDRMSPKGRGVYIYDPANGSFTLIDATNPNTNSDWTFVNRFATLKRNVNGTDYLFIYAATSSGLYRWKVNAANPSWTTAPTKVATGDFQDVIIISADNIAYASTPNKLYRVGNVTGESAAVEVTGSNNAFATASRIELAAMTDYNAHITYVYALVADSTGLFDGVYLTTNQQTWTRLTTSTVSPFTSENPGNLNAAISINPLNIKDIFIGGATLWNGEGFVENSYYQWTKQSASESELNYGNYMSTVYSEASFIHSGIHQIIHTWAVDNGDTNWVLYFATDGGVFKGTSMSVGSITYWTFKSLNKGLNTVQFNHIAVSPDGSIVGGAVDNSCPFIQARNAHEGALPSDTWYDDNDSSILNHISNIIWFGNGGGVASSMFQQLKPFTRRSLFVSAESGRFSLNTGMGVQGVASYARACADYADFTNTQTWTIAEGFVANTIMNTNPIPQIRLWETTNNTIWNDSITFNIDTNLTYIHNGTETAMSGNTVFVPGDSILVASKPNFDYPFYHKFTETLKLRDTVYYTDTVLVNGNNVAVDTFKVVYNFKQTVHNPVVSRIIVNGRHSDGRGTVYFNTTPNYFRNVWSMAESNSPNVMHWAYIYQANMGNSVGDIAFSRDGTNIFAAVTEDATGKSYIMRVYNFTGVDVNNPVEMKRQLNFKPDDTAFTTNPRVTLYDTIFSATGDFFNRPISSIAVDPREGQDNLIITFSDYNDGEPNMVIIKNATNAATRTVSNLNVVNSANNMTAADPVYSAIIECTTGTIYAGTEKGVFTTPFNGSSWTQFGAFNGVPVTSIVQQTRSLERQKYIAREGVNDVTYLFAKTKYPYAIYFGTYGRGVFMDTTYVTDHVAEVSNPEDYVGITTVDNGDNYMRIYPNPAADYATIDLGIVNAGNAVVKIYDVTGKMVYSENLGYLNEGEHKYSIYCGKFSRGVYLVNVNVGRESATSKLIVR